MGTVAGMKVALTVNDFLRRAELVYGDRIGRRSTSPTSRAESWGELTYARDRPSWPGRRPPALDALGIGAGRAGRDRVATTRPGCSRRSSASAARAGCSCRSTSGSTPTRSRYIVEHSGASVLLVDPELDDALAGVDARAPLRDRRRRPTTTLLPLRRRARAVGARRGRDRDDQLHDRHHRPAQGRAADPPQHLDQRRRRSAGRPASTTATSTCTRCRCSTATAGACRTR